MYILLHESSLSTPLCFVWQEKTMPIHHIAPHVVAYITGIVFCLTSVTDIRHIIFIEAQKTTEEKLVTKDAGLYKWLLDTYVSIKKECLQEWSVEFLEHVEGEFSEGVYLSDCNAMKSLVDLHTALSDLVELEVEIVDGRLRVSGSDFFEGVMSFVSRLNSLNRLGVVADLRD